MISNVTQNRAQNTNFKAARISVKYSREFEDKGSHFSTYSQSVSRLLQNMEDSVKFYSERGIPQKQAIPEMNILEAHQKLKEDLQKSGTDVVLSDKEAQEYFDAAKAKRENADHDGSPLIKMLQNFAGGARNVSEDEARKSINTMRALEAQKEAFTKLMDEQKNAVRNSLLA